MLFWFVPSLLLFAAELISVCSGDAIIVKLHDLRALNLEPHKGQTLSLQFLVGETHREYLKESEGWMEVVAEENLATLSIPDRNDDLAQRLFGIIWDINKSNAAARKHKKPTPIKDKLSLEFKVQEGIGKRKPVNRRCVWLAGEGSGGAAKLTAKELWRTYGVEKELPHVQSEHVPFFQPSGHYQKEGYTWHVEVHGKDIGDCPPSVLSASGMKQHVGRLVTSKLGGSGSSGSGSSAGGPNHHHHQSSQQPAADGHQQHSAKQQQQQQQHLWLVGHGDREDDKDADTRTKSGWAMIHGPRGDVNDPSLSPLGQKQAKESGKRIRQLLLGAAQNGDHKIDVVVVSPYLRCLETAKLIIDQLGDQLASPHRVLMEIGIAESPAYAGGTATFLKSPQDVNKFVDSAQTRKETFVKVDPHYSSCYTLEHLLASEEHPTKGKVLYQNTLNDEALNTKIQKRMSDTLNCLLGKEKGNVLVVGHPVNIAMVIRTLSKNDDYRYVAERCAISEYSRDPEASGGGGGGAAKATMDQHWTQVLSNAVTHMSVLKNPRTGAVDRHHNVVN